LSNVCDELFLEVASLVLDELSEVVDLLLVDSPKGSEVCPLLSTHAYHDVFRESLQ